MNKNYNNTPEYQTSEENNKTPQEMEQNKDDKRKNTFIRIGMLIVAIIIIILLLLKGCSSDGTISPPTFDLTQDGNVQSGKRETKSKEEIQAELNAKVAAGMINISMNLNPVFANGTAEGNLLIMNEDININPQVVEIYKDDTNELVYKSGLIPVGSRIDYGKLLIDLPAGEYPCTAYFNSVNGETGELLGKAGAEILIIVES